jgi:phospholipid/cholesterol/gamma-HCH transport system permease protein
MSSAAHASPLTGDAAHRLLLRSLARLGHSIRRRVDFVLTVVSLTLGVLLEALRSTAWRRTVRAEFSRSLSQVTGGGLFTTLIAAALAGRAIVYEALYWLGETAGESLTGALLVTVLVDGVAPVLVGLIVLGRSGMVMLSELGGLSIERQLGALEAQGLDPFALFLLPRACAFAVAAFTLGFVFTLTALITGFVAASLGQVATLSFWSFLDRVLVAMQIGYFVSFPLKMILIGLLVALTQGLTGLAAGPQDEVARLLPRGFMRGTLAILLVNIVLSMIASHL